MRKSMPPAAGERFFHGYELLEQFRTGGMSQAFKARSLQTGDTVFLKRVRVHSEKDRHALDREMEIYEKLRGVACKHVLQVIDVFNDDDYGVIVTEFADGGDLAEFVRQNGRGGGVPPPIARGVALELAAALQELHAQDVVHRDLKPGNILASGSHIKLADFGIAKNTARMLAKVSFKQFGSAGYAAPEQLAGVPAHPSADVFSFGRLLAFLLTGNSDPEGIPSPPWRRLALACTAEDPNQRPDLETLLAELAKLPG